MNKLIRNTCNCLVVVLSLTQGPAVLAQTDDGTVLPFPPQKMAGVARPRLQDSTMKWPKEIQRLPKDAPNILIALLDDVGFGVADTFGGEVHTPTLSKLAKEGIRYNAFHTTSICSPTRVALLTGRNHTRGGSFVPIGRTVSSTCWRASRSRLSVRAGSWTCSLSVFRFSQSSLGLPFVGASSNRGSVA